MTNEPSLKAMYDDFKKHRDRVSFLNDVVNKNRKSPFFEYLIASNFYVPDFDCQPISSNDGEIDLLLRSRVAFPFAFRQYLKNAKRARVFYDAVKARRDRLESAIISRLAFDGLNKFLNRMMEYISAMSEKQWSNQNRDAKNEVEILDYCSGTERVAAVSSLCRFAYELKETKETKCLPMVGPLSDEEVVNLSLLYENAKERVKDVFFFREQVIKMPFCAVARPSRLKKETSAGVRFSQFEEGVIKIGDKKSRIAHDSAIIGIDAEQFLEATLYGSLAYSDLITIEKEIAIILASCSSPRGVVIIPSSKKPSLFVKLGSEKKAADAIKLLFARNKKDVFDLYQTPFIPVDGGYISSAALLIHNNYSINLTSRAGKLGRDGIKGTAFEEEIEKFLNEKGFKTAREVKFKKEGGKEDGGDIDILACRGKIVLAFECKAEMTSMDYYDYRRERQDAIIAAHQLHRAKNVFRTPEGKRILAEKTGLKNAKPYYAILFSNSRQSCTSEGGYPILSLLELKAALEEGKLKVGIDDFLPVAQPRYFDFALFLRNKPLAKTFIRTTRMVSYTIKECGKKLRFYETHVSNMMNVVKIISNIYSSKQPCGISLRGFIHAHPFLFGFTCFLIIPILLRLFSFLIGLMFV